MGVRAGQGYGQHKPKRQLCPHCGKRGVGVWHVGEYGTVYRECQYCMHCWGTEGWKHALKLKGVNHENSA
jgi:hypothetical protein